LQLTPPGLEGDLYIGGPGLARGYLGRPGLTAERFIPDPFSASPGARLYCTGDRVRLLPDGNIVFIGRSDRQLKIRGHRIEPGEIEAAIRQAAGVKDCAVIADRPGLALAAFLVPAAAEQAGAGQGLVERVRVALGARLPEYMVPSRFVPVEALPLSPNGKLDQAALQLQLSQRPGAEGGYVPPRTPVEQALALIWAQTLGLDRVGIHDGFFAELGGHSILAMQIIARVRDALRIEVPLKLIFIAQTIERFAATLLEAAPAQRQALQRTAELYVRLSRMSEEELDRALAESSVVESSLVEL
jgi:nonribosomal peptide synthetase DhbF